MEAEGLSNTYQQHSATHHFNVRACNFLEPEEQRSETKRPRTLQNRFEMASIPQVLRYNPPKQSNLDT
eukprot:2369850-Amphidinium_carterae.1